jgi:hypothetical protein
VSHIESPSVQTAWRLRMAERGITLALRTSFEAVQSPDPRAPKGHVDLMPWSSASMRPSPRDSAR